MYRCNHCGNIAYKVNDSGVPMVCCGEKMELMKANSTDAATEKHVPVVEKNGTEYTITVGSVVHPMVEEHFIPMIAAVNENTVVFKHPKAGEEPVLKANLDGKVTAYEWCNLHGLWKAE